MTRKFLNVDLTKITCEHCRPRPDPGLASRPLSSFVGKFIQKTFATGVSRDLGQTYHYFPDARVCRVLEATENGTLRCRASTHPLFAGREGFYYDRLDGGEEVEVRPEEIEKVFDHFNSPIDSG